MNLATRWLNPLLSLAKLAARGRRGSPRHAKRQRRIRLEVLPLEDRVVPAGLVVTDLTSGLTAKALVASLLGSGVTSSNETLTAYAGSASNDVKGGKSSSAGEFTGGTGIIGYQAGVTPGFTSGIILSTGGVKNVIGPNDLMSSASQSNSLSGDADLTKIAQNVSGSTYLQTYDATILSFDFIPSGSKVSFNYVFSSEEYDTFAGGGICDAFEFVINGNGTVANDLANNYALVPGTSTPITINSIYEGKNPQYYIDNTDGHLNTQMNGLTTVLTITAPVNPGVPNHIKMAIADGSDNILDSNVFIQSGSFVSISALSFNTEPPAKSVAGVGFSAAVTDLLGGAVNAGASITFTISSNTLYSTDGGTAGTDVSTSTITTTTDASGIASFSGLSIELVGSYTITANVAATDTSTAATVISNSIVITNAPAATLSFTTQPPVGPLTAGSDDVGTVVVTAFDTYGNDVPGQSVSLGISSPGVIKSAPISATTQSDGTAPFTLLTVETAGAFTFSATAVSSLGTLNAPPSSSFTIVPAVPSIISFVGASSGTYSAGASFSPVTVLVTDAYSNPVQYVAVNIKTTSGSSLRGVPAILPSTNSIGEATFSSLSQTLVGTYTLTATAPILSPVLTTQPSGSYVITASAPAKISFASQPATGLSFTAGSYLMTASGVSGSNVFAVTVTDTWNNPVSGANVSLGISPSVSLYSTAYPTGTTSISNATLAGGTASFSALSVEKAGTYHLTATAGSLSATNYNTFFIVPGSLAQFSFVTQPNTTTAGNNIAATSGSYVTVKAGDTFGNGLSGIKVTMAINPIPASYQLAGTLTVATGTSGLAVFSSLMEKWAGTYTLSASVPSTYGMTAATSNPFTITPAQEALTFTQSPSSGKAGSALGLVSVKAVDPFGNAPANPITVTITIVSPGVLDNISSTISPYTTPITVTTSSTSTGQATFNIFTSLTVDKVGNYTLMATATANGVTAGYSSKFVISAASPYALSLVSQPTNTIAAVSIKPAVTVQVLDQFGNPSLTPNISVFMSIGIVSSRSSSDVQNHFRGGGSITSPIKTGSTGLATFSTLQEDISGTYWLQASTTYTQTGSTSVLSSSSQSSPFAILPGAPKTLSFVSQPQIPSGASSIVAGSNLNYSGVSLLLVDQFSNPVPNVGIPISIKPLGSTTPATLSSGASPLTTDSSGMVTFSNLSENKVGSYQLSASVGTATATSSQFPISASSAYGLSFTAQPTNTQAGKTINATSGGVIVQIVDKFGNPYGQSVPISVTVSSTTAPLVSTTTDSSGKAVFSTLQLTKTGTYALLATLAITNSQGQIVSGTSKSFAITAGTAASMTFTSQPSGGQVVNSTLGASTGTVIVQMLDQYGNYVNQPNLSVTITIYNATITNGIVTTGSSYGTKTTKATNSLGQAVFSLMLTTPGTYALRAISGSLSSVTSNAFIVTQAPPRWI